MKFFLSLLTGLFLSAASCTKTVAPQAAKPQPQPGTLRVLCYNIHHANPPSKPGIIDLDAIAAVIRAQSPDVVMLQEVDVRTKRSGTGLNQAEELARKTGLKPYFVKAIDYDGGEYGVAILSRYPLKNQQRYPLPGDPAAPGEPRVLGTAQIDWNGTRLTLACTHLDAQRAPGNRQVQAAEIGRILVRETGPVVLAGDFNDTPTSETLRILTEHFAPSCENCPPTIPVVNPNKTIDFVLMRPKDAFRVVEHRVIDERYASDHLPVLVVLEMN